VHVAQGRTVETTHLLVTESLSRQSLYVGMSRGCEANAAHVVTGSTAPVGQHPYQQATPESVLTSVMQRDAGEPSATEAIRQSKEWASGTGHLFSSSRSETRSAESVGGGLAGSPAIAAFLSATARASRTVIFCVHRAASRRASALPPHASPSIAAARIANVAPTSCGVAPMSASSSPTATAVSSSLVRHE
jgi:hypothetical protein